MENQLNGTFVYLKPDERSAFEIWKGLKCRDEFDESTLISYGYPFNEVTRDDLREETRLCYQHISEQLTYAEMKALASRRSLIECSFGDVLRFTDQNRQLREFCFLMNESRIAIAERNIRNQRYIDIQTMGINNRHSLFKPRLFLMKVN